ncbi:MAG: hypothetical protein ACTHNG_10960 [Ginsengibacter sp.]
MKFLILIFLSIFILFSCRKDSFITSADANLATSSDTLSFDTVFTSVGSVTQAFKIFNNNDQKLKISSVKLAGGTASPFKINVDGIASSEVNDIEINRNDSIYVFVQVNVNPSSATLPFILRDSIGIAFNGNQKWVQLQAYGQNAVFLKDKKITGNVTWIKTLPFVILGQLHIDTNATLKIEAGTKIYLHADAPLIVDGTLKATGTKDEPVIFSGDRLDEDYKDLPASWPGIIFRNTSKNDSLTHVTIKNAYQGIVATGIPGNSNPKVNLSKCRFDNIYDAGILGINTTINADNCLISNCGNNVNLQGGNYRFINCTVASYGTNFIAHTEPVLQLLNYYSDAGSAQTFIMNALFQNCIFWGDGGTVEDEIAIDKQGSSAFSVTFDHVLYKAKNAIPNADFISSIKNESPMFDSIDVVKNIFDFHFHNHPESPAVNSGTTTSFPSDLDDKSRDSSPDIGCYER